MAFCFPIFLCIFAKDFERKIMGEVNKETAHCSECVNYETVNYFMYCKYLKKRITTRKTPKYCKGFKIQIGPTI